MASRAKAAKSVLISRVAAVQRVPWCAQLLCLTSVDALHVSQGGPSRQVHLPRRRKRAHNARAIRTRVQTGCQDASTALTFLQRTSEMKRRRGRDRPRPVRAQDVLLVTLRILYGVIVLPVPLIHTKAITPGHRRVPSVLQTLIPTGGRKWLASVAASATRATMEQPANQKTAGRSYSR